MSSHIAAKVLHDETSVSIKVYLIMQILPDHENSNDVRWENQFTNTDTRHTYNEFLLWWSTNARACRIEFVVHQHPSQNTENIRDTDDESCFTEDALCVGQSASNAGRREKNSLSLVYAARLRTVLNWNSFKFLSLFLSRFAIAVSPTIGSRAVILLLSSFD